MVVFLLNIFQILLRKSDHFLEILEINRLLYLSDLFIDFDVLFAIIFAFSPLLATKIVSL